MSSSVGPDLGRTIANVLRAGTIVAVLGIAAGFALTVPAGSIDRGAVPVVDAIGAGGPDALIGAGLLVLTLTPPAALLAAAIVLYRLGERRRALVAGVVVLLLAGSLAAAAAIGLAT